MISSFRPSVASPIRPPAARSPLNPTQTTSGRCVRQNAAGAVFVLLVDMVPLYERQGLGVIAPSLETITNAAIRLFVPLINGMVVISPRARLCSFDNPQFLLATTIRVFKLAIDRTTKKLYGHRHSLSWLKAPAARCPQLDRTTAANKRTAGGWVIILHKPHRTHDLRPAFGLHLVCTTHVGNQWRV
jgi:hypothetical protein